uniref:uncharacterized protein LOC120338794 n=1 Tax=Styela clava TaxID=7725 RepID=UPI00193A0EF2|nr:uncharacterized protein LOC120338794 [Styela clava]
MAARACDFSSFKRPPKPLNTDSLKTTSDGTTSLKSNELNHSVDGSAEMDGYPSRKYMTSQSVDPNMTARGANYDYFSGSMSTFKDAMSPANLSPTPISTFSNQNVDSYSSFQRTPKANHSSTIDRTTLPYDRRHKMSKFNPNGRETPNRQDESGVGSGLLFLDGGRRGVMNADSQHSLDDSLSGRRMDRSLAKGRNELSAADNDLTNGGATPPYNGALQYTQVGSMPTRSHHGAYAANHGTPYDVYYSPPYVDNGLPVQSNTTYQDYHNETPVGPNNSHHNVSSGESGIAGCEFNTLGMSYDTYGPAGTGYGYNAAAAKKSVARGYESPVAYGNEQGDVMNDVGSQQSRLLQRTIESRGSNGESSKSSRGDNGSLAHREEYGQRALLLPTESALRLGSGSDAPDNGVTIYEHNDSFTAGTGSYSNPQKSSIPRINSRTSAQGRKGSFNPFKKDKTPTDPIYRGNNLYSTKNKKSTKHNSHVTLGSSGLASTGLGFSKTSYVSTKRPFCPRWQCIALTVAIGITVFLAIGLIVYFYVWPSVLQPLVESSQPVDGEWGSWRPWFQCSASCGEGIQNRTRECDSPSPEDGGKECDGLKYQIRTCNAPIECPDCSRICDVGTLSKDCRRCTCEGHIITGKITDEYENPLPGVKIYKGDGATLLLGGTNNDGKFQFEGVCSNGDNELRLEKEMYRISLVHPTQSKTDQKAGFVSFSMTRLFLPTFTLAPTNEERLADQKVVLCCEAESEQPPSRYIWYKDNSRLDPSVYGYSLENPSLILPELMVWDGGQYACEVQNEAGVVKSDPATLTVYGNWTDLCDPKPRDKFVPLPEGCSQTTFNTGACGNEKATGTLPDSVDDENNFARCIEKNQYPNDSPNDVCTEEKQDQALRDKYCCKPLEEEEVTVSCKLQELTYNMSLKRILSCGCTICE